MAQRFIVGDVVMYKNRIAENIYDWWISGKSYKQWYAEKFQQLKLDFGDEI